MSATTKEPKVELAPEPVTVDGQEVTAEEIEQTLRAIRSKRLLDDEVARMQKIEEETGFKSYFLANARYPWERIQVPGTRDGWYRFTRGRMLIDSAEKEQVVTEACGHRLHTEDLDSPRACRACGTLWWSSSAWTECQLKH